ncbi:MAG TPA: macrolide ABC transporter ATP-binding protein, partial [Chitinophagales bacterium]|nr:macrolide ABC transporter ATP-binding protein [Chitinophagales bacterium]
KTSYEIMAIMEDISRRGNTVIIVTHEEDIARHARRIMRLRDGLIETDIANTPVLAGAPV